MASEHVCPVCYLQQEREVFQFKECRHQFCRSCVRSHCIVRLKEFHVSVPCLYPNCSAQLTPPEIQSLVSERAFAQYLEQSFRRWLAKAQGVRSCPAPDCPYVELLQDSRSICQMKFVCQHPNCGKEYCYKCKRTWHPGQECISNEELKPPCQNTKPCPRCGCFILKEKDGSCNHMKCTFCGTDFCWLCLKEIGEFHYFRSVMVHYVLYHSITVKLFVLLIPLYMQINHIYWGYILVLNVLNSYCMGLF